MELPQEFDWKRWINRWERMQERYLVKRSQRFDLIGQLLEEIHPNVTLIVDVGCGPGSLTMRLLEMFPEAQLMGIDLDPTLLPLARLRTERFGARVRFLQRDLRKADWIHGLVESADAVVSATALHWMNAQQLASVYQQIAAILRPGGLFLNADHVGSEFVPLQQFWEWRRDALRKQQPVRNGDDWDTFWKAYLDALGDGVRKIRQQALGKWEGIEHGLPLAWHVDHLRQAGFEHVDCFWRSDCDAIYGGIRLSPRNTRKTRKK